MHLKATVKFHSIVVCYALIIFYLNYIFHAAGDETVGSKPMGVSKNGTVFKVGVVGGGIGGTATAYFLRNAFKKEVILSLFEPKEIGGRLSTSTQFENQYETGGAIIHSQNRYMNSFIKDLGLKKNPSCESVLGLFDGQTYAFTESNWKIITFAKLLYRYGLDVFRLQRFGDAMLKQFDKIYENQKKGLSYRTVADLLYSMHPKFPELTKVSIRTHLKEQGFHDLVIDELLTCLTRANYGQLSDVHAFVGSVSVAAADPDAWSVKGGNKMVPEALLLASQAARLNQAVTEVINLPNKKIRVVSETKDGKKQNYDFDAVSVATPLTKDKSTIKFTNFTETFDFPGGYQQIICTMVQGKLNGTTFKYSEVGGQIEEILTYNSSLFYNSVGKQFPVGRNQCNLGDANVYKIFSPNVLTKEELSLLLENYTNIESINWLAYPHYLSSETLGRFELSPGLYYNNAIEKAASAMEMSAIAAKNNALLIEKYLRGENLHEDVHKDEL